VFDLVISRGAMWFWDKAESVREIWRVLAAGGSAVIGGGYGTSAMKADIYRKLSRLNGEDFTVSRKKFTESAGPEDYVPALRRLGVPHFRCVHDESGDWLHFQKPCVAVFASEGA
jgi:SAM-dependent methyltransferase